MAWWSVNDCDGLRCRPRGLTTTDDVPADQVIRLWLPGRLPIFSASEPKQDLTCCFRVEL